MGHLGIDTWQGHRDKAKLKCWLLCQRIGTQRSCLARTGTSSHIEVDRGRFEVE